MFDSNKYFLITDVGSTTTKALLLENYEGKLKYKCEANVATTVEKPFEDVKIGLYRAIEQISNSTGLEIMDDDKKISIPYFSTSSAGGGLQMLVFGLTKTETGRVAQMAAYGAGGVILDTFTADDKVSNLEKMTRIRELKPDMILMAGGIDGGGIWGTLGLAEILSLSDPAPKYKVSGKIPLIFCGNVESRGFISEMLADRFELENVPNVRPTITDLNLYPAQEKVHEIFMNNVMEQAPGYQELKNSTAVDILPTPLGVEKILSLYARKKQKNVVMLDMGGATTDIFSCIKGKYNRTVSANIGLSYSIANILKEAGVAAIMAHLPSDFTEANVRNYICNKMLNPTYLPDLKGERLVEVACAIEGIKLAWHHHRDMHFNIANVGFLDRRKEEAFSVFGKVEEVFSLGEETELEKKRHFQLSEIDMIIGAGGVFSSSKSIEELFVLLVEGILPSGVTKLAVDRNFKSPHMGVFSQLAEEKAIDAFMESSLEELGFVIAPIGSVKKGKTVLSITDMVTGERTDLKGGEVLYLENGGRYEILLKRNFVLSNVNISGIYEIDTVSPILVDCRGRGKAFIDCPIISKVLDRVDFNVENPVTVFPKNENYFSTGEFELVRELPYQGKIMVQEGDRVVYDDVLGENDSEPPKIYLLDLKRLIGYDYKLTKEEVKRGLLVGIGDLIEKEQPVFKLDFKIAGEKFYLSSIAGVVEKIEASGLLIIREVQDYSTEPLIVDISEELGVSSDSIIKYLKCRKNGFVAKGQLLAARTKKTSVFSLFGNEDLKSKENEKLFSGGNRNDDQLKVFAPKAGFIRNIDPKQGNITIHYDAKPVEMKSLVSGVVARVSRSSEVVLKGAGTVIYGKIGFGREATGIVKIIKNGLNESFKDCIAVSIESINKEILLKAAEIGVKGIIAPAMNNGELVSFMGEEIGAGITGDENLDFVVVLTEGFGELMLDEKVFAFFKSVEGKTAAMLGRTRIRAGVERPKVIISDLHREK